MPESPAHPEPTSKLGKLVDRALARLGRALSDPEGRKMVVARVGRFLRGVTGVLAWAVLIGVPGLLFFTRYAGELLPATAFLLYLPPALWLVVPVLVLLPALVLRWKLGVALAVLLVVSPWWLFGYRSGGSIDPGDGDGITVLTYNSGQSGALPLGVVAGSGFAAEVNADVVAMQDTYVYFRNHKLGKGFQPPALATYPHLHRHDEFVTYSKFAFVESAPVRLRVNGRSDTVAIRHVIDAGGRLVVFYNVHLPTPRNLLKRASPTAIVVDYFGPDSTSDPVDKYQRALQDGWDAQTETALSLLARIRAETLPTIAAGDFNFSRHGYLARSYRDAMAEALPADGCGFTFPGTTRNPLSFGKPWMRLDHLFSADPALLFPESASTERGRRSQHLATAATFRFR